MTRLLLALAMLLVGCDKEKTITEPTFADPDFKAEVTANVEKCGLGVVTGQDGENKCKFTQTVDLNFSYKTHTGLLIPEDWKDKATWRSVIVRDLPAHFDWRDEQKGLCPGYKQGSCGSCWAFASAHVYSDLLRLARPSVGCREVSQQAMIDCSPSYGSCRGGYYALGFFEDPYGPVDTANYGPYLAKNRRCKKSKLTYDQTAQIKSWHYVGSKDAEAGPTIEELKSAIYTYGPIAITERGFGSGVQGIHDGCPATKGTNHMTSLIGFTHLNKDLEFDPEGDLFWIRRNSWSNTGDAHYGALVVRATGRNGRKCANMGRTAAFAEIEGFPSKVTNVKYVRQRPRFLARVLRRLAFWRNWGWKRKRVS